MRPSQLRLAALAATVAVCALMAAACGAGSGTDAGESGSGGEVDLDAGRQLFQTTCRACHSLADAKAAGVFGPDLDLLQPDEERVREQIESGGGGMPEALLEGEDADLVAAYVATVAAAGPDEASEPQRRGSTKARPDA